jgi:hypothetical protein
MAYNIRCDKCKWWDATEIDLRPEPYHGLCKRRSPQRGGTPALSGLFARRNLLGDGTVGCIWPVTTAADFCGDFQAIPKTRKQTKAKGV